MSAEAQSEVDRVDPSLPVGENGEVQIAAREKAMTIGSVLFMKTSCRLSGRPSRCSLTHCCGCGLRCGLACTVKCVAR